MIRLVVSLEVRMKLSKMCGEEEKALDRFVAGIQIAQLGLSEVTHEGVWVKAPGKTDRFIAKDQPCSCEDQLYNKPWGDRCKHRWAANALILHLREARHLSVLF